MAFEETPKPTPAPAPVVKRRVIFDSSAFLGIIIGLLVIALVLFLFRKPIANRIAQWRNASDQVATTTTVPIPTVAPASSTPTPTATVAPPTTTPKVTHRTTTGTTSSRLPQSGPDDSLLVAGLAAVGSSIPGLRFLYYRRRLRNAKPVVQ